MGQESRGIFYFPGSLWPPILDQLFAGDSTWNPRRKSDDLDCWSDERGPLLSPGGDPAPLRPLQSHGVSPGGHGRGHVCSGSFGDGGHCGRLDGSRSGHYASIL